MSFMPTGRALQRFYGWLFTAMALFFISMPLWIETDEAGPIFALIFAAAAGLRAAWHFWRASKLAPTTPAFPDHSKLPIDERKAVVKRSLLIGTPGVVALSAWVAWDLSRLEAGTTQSVYIWAPLSLAYDLGGYWAAVLGLPVLWSAIMINAYFKLWRPKPGEAA